MDKLCRPWRALELRDTNELAYNDLSLNEYIARRVYSHMVWQALQAVLAVACTMESIQVLQDTGDAKRFVEAMVASGWYRNG